MAVKLTIKDARKGLKVTWVPNLINNLKVGEITNVFPEKRSCLIKEGLYEGSYGAGLDGYFSSIYIYATLLFPLDSKEPLFKGDKILVRSFEHDGTPLSNYCNLGDEVEVEHDCGTGHIKIKGSKYSYSKLSFALDPASQKEKKQEVTVGSYVAPLSTPPYEDIKVGCTVEVIDDDGTRGMKKGDQYQVIKIRSDYCTISIDSPMKEYYNSRFKVVAKPSEITKGCTVEVLSALGTASLINGEQYEVLDSFTDTCKIMIRGTTISYEKWRFKVVAAPTTKLPEKIIPGCIVKLKRGEISYVLTTNTEYQVGSVAGDRDPMCVLKGVPNWFACSRFDIVGFKELLSINSPIKTSEDGNTNPGECPIAVKVQSVKVAIAGSTTAAECAVRVRSRPNICTG